MKLKEIILLIPPINNLFSIFYQSVWLTYKHKSQKDFLLLLLFSLKKLIVLFTKDALKSVSMKY